MTQFILIITIIAIAFFVGKFFNVIKAKFREIKFQPNGALIIIVAVLCVLLGVVIGKWPVIVKSLSGSIGAIALPKAPIVKNAQVFVLCDFESDKDIAKWNVKEADVSMADEHVTSGRRSGRFKYTGNVELGKAAMEKYLSRDTRLGDWEGYKYLLVDIYNMQANSEPIKLKIKDENDKTFQRDMVIPSKRSYTIKIYLSELKASVNIRKIRQVNLFRWDAKKDAVFYVDNIRLVNDETNVAPPVVTTTETGASKDVSNTVNGSKPEVNSIPNIARISEKKELIYLLRPDLDSWRVTKDGVVPVTRFNATIADNLNIGRRSAPATGGIPFAEGELRSIDNVRLMNKDGLRIPMQAKVTARWPDGSIKWILFDIQTDTEPAHVNDIYVEYGDGVKGEEVRTPLKISYDGDDLILISGPLKAVMNSKKFDLIGTVYMDMNGDGKYTPEEVVSSGGDMYMVFKGKRYYASKDVTPTNDVETEGTERIALKRSGWFVSSDGERFCKYILRIEAFKGKSYFRIYHTFIYTGYPENKYYERYDGLALPKNEPIDEIGILIPQSFGEQASYSFGTDQGIAAGVIKNDVSLFQSEADSFTFSLGSSPQTVTAKRLSGWIDLKSAKAGMAVAVRNLWQQYPKGFEIKKTEGLLDVKIWPSKAGALDLKTTENAIGPDDVARGNAFGLAKTHELYLYFHKTDLDDKVLDMAENALMSPGRIRPDPKWIASTAVLGGLRQYDPKRFYEAETALGELFDWAYRQPKAFKWYGMIDFGDTLSWYRQEAYDKSYDTWGWHPEGRWGWFNCEVAGTHSGALIQYLRTGKEKYFEFGENLARHIMDVDTCHYNTVANDPRLKGLLDDEVSQVGSMHRHSGDHWSGRNEEATHTNVYGILLYYYLTGYERALEVAKESGSFFLKGPITYTRHPDIAPQRAISNILWGEMLLYETTQDEAFKKAADKWAKLLVDGQNDDGFWTDTYNPMDNVWTGPPEPMFMSDYTLPALIQYHVDTRDNDVGNAIVKATDYLIAHEEYRGYFSAIAYSYWLTGDSRYQAFMENYLAKFTQGVKTEGDDLHRGMIFDKLIYTRPNEYLREVPFVFSALSFRLKSTTPLTTPTAKKDTDASITYSTSVVTPLYKVFPDSRELLNTKSSIELSMAKNEYESSQLIVYDANKKLNDITLEYTDLENKTSGQKISKDNIECRLVEYVKTKQPDYQVERTGFWPDPLSDKKVFSVEPNAIQSIWVTIYAPKGTPAGIYDGKLVIKPANAKEKEIALKSRVFNFGLPNNPSYKTAFDLYPGRMKVVYPKLYQEDQERYDMRITGLINKYYDSMILFKISPVLNLNYPDATFDSRLRKYMDDGISAFGIGPFGGSFDNKWPADASGIEDAVNYFKKFADHLAEKNWMSNAYVYTYDEPGIGDPKVAEAASIVHRGNSKLKNMVCLTEMPDPRDYKGWFKDIDIVCFRNWGFDYDLAKEYTNMGKEIWIYVSGPRPPFPNLAIDYPAMAYRIIPWMSWKYNASGLLYWCVNFWNGDPWKDPMNTKWQQNGNGFLFYPADDGPVPTIRLYVLRDGIEDYEYLNLLSQAIARSKTSDQELLSRAKDMLNIDTSIVESMATYTKDPALIMKRRQEIAEMIEKL